MGGREWERVGGSAKGCKRMERAYGVCEACVGHVVAWTKLPRDSRNLRDQTKSNQRNGVGCPCPHSHPRLYRLYQLTCTKAVPPPPHRPALTGPSSAERSASSHLRTPSASQSVLFSATRCQQSCTQAAQGAQGAQGAEGAERAKESKREQKRANEHEGDARRGCPPWMPAVDDQVVDGQAAGDVR